MLPTAPTAPKAAAAAAISSAVGASAMGLRRGAFLGCCGGAGATRGGGAGPGLLVGRAAIKLRRAKVGTQMGSARRRPRARERCAVGWCRLGVDT